MFNTNNGTNSIFQHKSTHFHMFFEILLVNLIWNCFLADLLCVFCLIHKCLICIAPIKCSVIRNLKKLIYQAFSKYFMVSKFDIRLKSAYCCHLSNFQLWKKIQQPSTTYMAEIVMPKTTILFIGDFSDLSKNINNKNLSHHLLLKTIQRTNQLKINWKLTKKKLLANIAKMAQSLISILWSGICLLNFSLLVYLCFLAYFPLTFKMEIIPMTK